MKTVYFQRVTDITPKMLADVHVNTIFLDIDNTIKYTGTTKLLKGTKSWIANMHKNNINIILLSNNFKNSFHEVATNLNLKCVYFSLKPSPFGYLRAKKRYKINFKNTVVIGDQVFTDIFGAKLCGIRAFMVRPLNLSGERVTVKIRRFFCKRIYNSIVNRVNPLLSKGE